MVPKKVIWLQKKLLSESCCNALKIIYNYVLFFRKTLLVRYLPTRFLSFDQNVKKAPLNSKFNWSLSDIHILFPLTKLLEMVEF